MYTEFEKKLYSADSEERYISYIKSLYSDESIDTMQIVPLSLYEFVQRCL